MHAKQEIREELLARHHVIGLLLCLTQRSLIRLHPLTHRRSSLPRPCSACTAMPMMGDARLGMDQDQTCRCLVKTLSAVVLHVSHVSELHCVNVFLKLSSGMSVAECR